MNIFLSVSFSVFSLVSSVSQVCDGASGEPSSTQWSDPAGGSAGGRGGQISGHAASQRPRTETAQSRQHTQTHHYTTLSH